MSGAEEDSVPPYAGESGGAYYVPRASAEWVAYIYYACLLKYTPKGYSPYSAAEDGVMVDG